MSRMDQEISDAVDTSTDSVNRTFDWLPWLQLMRIGNVFTAFANILMGYLVIHSDAGIFDLGRADFLPLAGLFAATFCLYCSGMVLNDVFDLEQDREQRPNSPLAAGRVRPETAARLGWGLWLLGIGFSATAGWNGFLLGLAVAFAIVAYNRILKKTFAAPVAMGACRFLNVLLGMSYAKSSTPVIMGFEDHHLIIAAGIGVFVAGLTWFARTETRTSNRWMLGGAIGVMSLGFICLAYFPVKMSEAVQLHMTADSARMWFLVLAILVLYRCVNAVVDPDPQRVQRGVIHALRSLIFLDASVVAVVSHPFLAVATLSLLFPMLICSKWIRTT